jgi:LPXTG-motif cell wall-anchored protein
MYHKSVLTVGGGAGLAALPHTGLDVVWFAIGAFALVMAAGAVLRTLPKRRA